MKIFNPWCAVRVTVYTWSVCLSVTMFSATTCNKATKINSDTRRFVAAMASFKKKAIVVKQPCSKSYKPENQANELIICKLALAYQDHNSPHGGIRSYNRSRG